MSPKGSFWCVRRELHETTNAVVLEQAIVAMREVYPELELENVVDLVVGEKIIGIDMHFFCLVLTGTASVRIWDTNADE